MRRTYCDCGKVKNGTLANVTKLGPDFEALTKAFLRGASVGPLGGQLENVRSWHQGHVKTVLLAMQRLSLAELLGPRPCRERALVLAMAAARLLALMGEIGV